MGKRYGNMRNDLRIAYFQKVRLLLYYVGFHKYTFKFFDFMMCPLLNALMRTVRKKDI